MHDIPALFGSMVFNEEAMKERLPQETCHLLKETITQGKPLDLSVANQVAEAMKDWAVERGVTHYTHWFQPLTGITAEKHESFIDPTPEGNVIMKFSGKALIKGESDASSFPSGGLRSTFEARGYTAWDPTSYAFIKDGILCIPTVFCSYGGELLDNKTPLLRSMEAVNTQCLRILRLFGNTTATRVTPTVGPEQEYFLVDRAMFHKRMDLMFCGRTLFGARSPKGQEMDDHYYGSIRPRVAAFMKELDEELWKLGVLAKTKHNEVAPAQHELAPIFTNLNTATDHNQITMEVMRRVAGRHNIACLLHEKPFAGVNGSGKHDNWSLTTSEGVNLLEPGSSPQDNAQFLLFLCAVIKAVDEHQDLLRLSVASAGNDCRLGGNEAPPAIISIFLGDQLTEILESLAAGEEYDQPEYVEMEIGVDALPHFPRDTTDRNRTSPFAFSGNKFEFRMVGSSQSIADPNVMLNTAVADALSQFADQLEGAEDFKTGLARIIRRTLRHHRRIIFNGNNYSPEWEEEARKRGLKVLRATPDALPCFVSQENIDLFARHGIFTPAEMHARYEIMNETYVKMLHIEAVTMLHMTRRQILPAVSGYVSRLCQAAARKTMVDAALPMMYEKDMAARLSALTDGVYADARTLEDLVKQAETMNVEEGARFYCDSILPAMDTLRAKADEMEELMPREEWPFPTYGDLLYSV